MLAGFLSGLSDRAKAMEMKIPIRKSRDLDRSDNDIATFIGSYLIAKVMKDDPRKFLLSGPIFMFKSKKGIKKTKFCCLTKIQKIVFWFWCGVSLTAILLLCAC